MSLHGGRGGLDPPPMEQVATATTAIAKACDLTGWSWPWIVGVFIAGAVAGVKLWPMVQKKIADLKK